MDESLNIYLSKSYLSIIRLISVFVIISVLSFDGVNVFEFIAIVMLIASLINKLHGIIGFFHREPIMTISRDGIHLPCAENAFLPYDIVNNYWITKHQIYNDIWNTFSIQCSPRQSLNTKLWYKINGIKVDTLLEGDIVFIDKHLECKFQDIAETIDLYREMPV